MIRLDPSLASWGAVCGKTHTGGLWSPMEQGMHINGLELKAATLALVKDQIKIMVLLQLDSQTAESYEPLKGTNLSPAHRSG